MASDRLKSMAHVNFQKLWSEVMRPIRTKYAWRQILTHSTRCVSPRVPPRNTPSIFGHTPRCKILTYIMYSLVAFSSLSTVTNTIQAAPNITVSGSLPPDLSNISNMDLTVTVRGISDKRAPLGEGELSLAHRLEVKILNSDSSSDIATVIKPLNENSNNNFYWDRTATEPVLNLLGNDDNEIIFNLSISEQKIRQDQMFEKLLETQGESVGLRIEVSYYTYDKDEKYHTESPKPSSAKVFIAQIFAIPSVSPEGFSAAGTHQRISIEWSKDSKVAYSDGESRAPAKVIAIVLKTNGVPGETINLDTASKVSTLSKDPATQGACTFTRNANEGADCIACAADNTYIDLDLLKNITGAESSTSISNSGIASIGNVDEDPDGKAPYTIALQYKFGSTRTVCYNVGPENNRSLTELLDSEQSSGAESIRCFIATAAYGSIFDKHIKIFRWFRNEILLPSRAGQHIVDLYYRLSPPLANFIANHATTRLMTRLALFPLGVLLHCLKFFLANLLMVALVTAVVFVLGVFLSGKRRHSPLGIS